jgi:hypothetical protein
MLNTLYLPVWHKYRPAILKLMMDSSQEPQKYSLSGHEFIALNPRQKGGFQFKLHVSGGKAQNNIRESYIAQSLLYILQQSKKGSELIEMGSYEISLDKQFVLHINKVEVPDKVEVEQINNS